MARTVRNAKLDSRSARVKLPADGQLHWISLSRGRAIGYRKGVKGGVWLAKIVDEFGRRQTTLAAADDVIDANGNDILSHAQAQAKAHGWFEEKPTTASAGPRRAPYTVALALDDYLDAYRAGHTKGGGKSEPATTAAIDAHIRPVLGSGLVADLTAERIRQWHAGLAKAPARLRGKAGVTAQRETADDVDAIRRRRATANRVLTILKAALNHAYQEGKVGSDDAWRRVKPFREANAPTVRYLSRDECARLVNACPDDFRRLVQGALLSGLRYGELCNLTAADFRRDGGTLNVRVSKSGKPRSVYLDSQGVDLFEDLTAGRPADAIIFLRADGKPWGKSHQHRPIRDAAAAARIAPAPSFHILRHTYASALVMAGAPLAVVASNLGHADTRMTERHYAHLAPSYVADAIRAAMPKLEIVERSIVSPLRISTADLVKRDVAAGR